MDLKKEGGWDGKLRYLTQSAVKDEGVFAFNFLKKLGDVLGETIVCVVKRTGYVTIITPLIVSHINDGDGWLAFEREKLGACYV